MARGRVPRTGVSPSEAKQPKALIGTSYNDLHPSWRFNHIDWDHPFVDFEITPAHLKQLAAGLSQLEKRTWNEILISSKKQNHNIYISELQKKAQDRLKALFDPLDFDQLLSLRLSARERIWGVLSEGVVTLIWWDPNHQVCPSLLKHT